MSLSPIIWKCHGSWSVDRPDRTHVYCITDDVAHLMGTIQRIPNPVGWVGREPVGGRKPQRIRKVKPGRLEFFFLNEIIWPNKNFCQFTNGKSSIFFTTSLFVCVLGMFFSNQKGWFCMTLFTGGWQFYNSVSPGTWVMIYLTTMVQGVPGKPVISRVPFHSTYRGPISPQENLFIFGHLL